MKDISHSQPLVSIVIPVFNGENHISSAIESVLTQNYFNLEVLVIDDGSIDNTWSVVNGYSHHERVQLFSHEGRINKGVSCSRKLGVENAKGKYLAFLDADDYFLEGKISQQVKILEENEDVVLCHGGFMLVSENKPPSGLKEHFSLSKSDYKYDYRKEDYFLTGNRICNSTSMVRTDQVKDLDFASPQLFQYEDFLLWVLLSEKGTFYYISNELIKYRFHDNSATAKTLSNPLRFIYSKIELYLTLLTKVTDQSLMLDVGLRLRQNLFYLLERYSLNQDDESNRENCADALATILSPDFSSEALFLEKKIQKLEKELNDVKKTLLWKIYSLFKGVK